MSLFCGETNHGEDEALKPDCKRLNCFYTAGLPRKIILTVGLFGGNPDVKKGES